MSSKVATPRFEHVISRTGTRSNVVTSPLETARRGRRGEGLMRNDLEGKEKSPKIGSINKEYGLTKFNSNDIHYLRREKGRPLDFVLVGIVRVFF